MTNQNHVHKLRRTVYKTGTVAYFCVLPDCNYRVVAKLTLGKRSICNRCGKEFLMNEYSIRLEKPHCNDCTKKTVSESASAKPIVPILKGISNDTTADLRSRLEQTLKTVKSSEALATADDDLL